MEDERLGTQYAKLLFEKGFDNVYLLSGGMDKFLETHHELVEGTKIPEKVNPKDQKVKPSTAKKSGLSTTSSVMGKSQVSFKK
jgi:centrosomal protein CEP41